MPRFAMACLRWVWRSRYPHRRRVIHEYNVRQVFWLTAILSSQLDQGYSAKTRRNPLSTSLST